MDYEVLGWLSAGILGIQLAPFAIRLILKMEPPFQEQLKNLRSFFRKVHKPAGLLLLFIPAVHGFLALGAFRLHTGTLVGLASAAAVLSGIGFHLAKKKRLLSWHRWMAMAAGALLGVHLLMPWLLG